ncbi:DUF4232 domain-containing protein [Streptomyces sp. NPDC059582]|uniref:DUF4232 domain-containing protein n=1 Tax=Streptomyces sp. NPDC059582 TaxID=3346875 RepID=UPI0036C4DF0D
MHRRLRTRPAVAAPAAALLLSAAVVLALFAAAPQSRADAGPDGCRERAVTLRAAAVPGNPAVVRVSVTNHGRSVCALDLIPTVVFGNLDGAALPLPSAAGGTYRLGPGRTAYAAVRTVAEPTDPQARGVHALTVAADPSHRGRAFTAAQLGTGGTIRVWEPVTTYWQPSAAAADGVLDHG